MAQRGDIAIVGYGADAGVKSLAFVLLADLAGETIYFTDNGWQAAGGFRANEGTVSYTVPAGAAIGTVVTIDGLTGQLNPSTSGDQILAYTGTAAAPTFLFGIDFADGNTTWAGDATSSNTSAVPPGLTLGVDALAFAEDNAAYTGPLSGTPAQIRAAIADPANWTVNDAAGVPYAAGFDVGPTGPVPPRVSVSDIGFAEGDAGERIVEFTVTRAGGTEAFELGYATADGSATAGEDYRAAAGTIRFAEGQTEARVAVTVLGDTRIEGDETFTLTLSNDSGTVTLDDPTGTATIRNDDGLPATLSIGDTTVTEGNAGETIATFTVTRTGGTGAVSVGYQTASGTAVAGEDFTGTSGRIDFAEGQTTATISVAVSGDSVAEGDERFFVTLADPSEGATIGDGLGTGTILNDDFLKISDVQGSARFSPILAAEGVTSFNTASAATVTIQAVVTALDGVGARQGFYLMEEQADWDDSALTSEGIYLMTRNDSNVGTTLAAFAPDVKVGDLVTITARVMEYQQFQNMPRTMLVSPASYTIVSSGNAVPTLVLDGQPGRAIPSAILTDSTPDYRLSTAGEGFDPTTSALDFFETIEGMQVTIPDMVVADGFVGLSGGRPFLKAYSTVHADADQINARGGYTIAGDPPLSPPDTATLADDTQAGGRFLHDGDVNPDILEVDFTDFAVAPPTGLQTGASMGDRLGDVTGVIDWDFTDLKLFVTQPLTPQATPDTSPVRETTTIVTDDRALTYATFNVENLDPTDGAARFAAIAQAIATNLKAPDILSIEEIQDNNGAAAGDGTAPTGADASQTWQLLVDALNAATGQRYQWVDEEPVYNAEGGQQSGNIRVGFLYNTNRVQLGDLAADATIEERRQYTDRIGDGERDEGDRIAFDDSQIAIDTADWAGTRKSLLAEFTFNGNAVYATANHLPSKGGSGEFWQLNQNVEAGAPANAGWAQRSAIAEDLWTMMDRIQSADGANRIISGGDFNDFHFYRPLEAATGYVDAAGNARTGGARFDNLTVTKLSEAERYTYAFDGRSQAIDHVLVDQQLGAVANYDVVHINTGYNNRGGDNPRLSDHDPALAQFDFRDFGETLRGTAGADLLEGFGGDDVLIGGAGNDRLFGGTGDDLLAGGTGNDQMTGGTGRDIYLFDNRTGTGVDRIFDFGVEDALLTTVQVRDGNRNGIIEFGSDRRLDLLAGANEVAITSDTGAVVRQLEYDGIVVRGGQTYYMYSRVGSAIGTADVGDFTI
ncbi:MAG: hypothetical protein PGN09_09610 [Sphingomonas fennica]